MKSIIFIRFQNPKIIQQNNIKCIEHRMTSDDGVAADTAVILHSIYSMLFW